ncbi:MAG TPA: T9SS type A sorting domain-containing protein, partial [Daejeonella sp.]|nr:T9SS type A sorting domain-containing protein [Daejeonella sp.]
GTVDSTGADIVVIVDSLDFTAPPNDVLTEFKAIPLVTGITAGEFTVVPGALLSNNFDITYGLGKLTILPAPLSVRADDKVIYYGSALPAFTSTITGYQFNDSTTVTGPVYALSPPYSGKAGIYSIVPSNLTFNPANPSYQITYTPGTLYVNPKGPGTKKVKPYLECVEVLTNHPSGFKYAANFSYENSNATPVYVPVGPDNLLKSLGSFSGQPPVLFLPGTGKFKIYFDGAKLTWTVRTYEVNQQAAVASEASSTSSRCKPSSITSALYQTMALTEDMKNNRSSKMQGNDLDLNKVQVYPNPVTDLVTVQWDNISDEDVTITDVNGRAVSANNIRKLSENTLEVNLSGLNAGLYLIKVKNQQHYKVLRIIKM